MEEKLFIEKLLSATREREIPLSENQARLCFRHIQLMLQWNGQMNLTRITDLDEILSKHLLDSLLPSPWLPHAGPALDVGTGAGFPGVPLKILHPGLDMVLLEAHRKKVSFLKVLLAGLSLENIQALQKRWEEMDRTVVDPVGKRGYKLITMRAVRLEEAHITHLAAHLLEPGGVFAWWAGPGASTTVDQAKRFAEKAEMTFEEEFSYPLPSTEHLRRIFIWRKTER